jgi:hypothetical protein
MSNAWRKTEARTSWRHEQEAVPVKAQSNQLGINICKCYMSISISIPHLLFNASLGHRRFAFKALPRILGTSELPQHIMRALQQLV